MRTIAYAVPLALALLVLGCSRSPESPPPSASGAVAAFDSLLSDANTKWSFVFADDFRIMLTDASGTDEAILLDLREATGYGSAKWLGCKSISPDGRFILAAYYYTRSSEDGQPDAHLLLLDLDDLSTREVPVGQEGFKLGWLYDTHWLNEHTFLVCLSKHVTRENGYPKEVVRYVCKDVQDLTAARIVPLDTEDPVTVWHPKSSALLFASEHEPTTSWTVWAFDINGRRQATPDETDYLNHKRLDRGYDPDSPVEVRVDPVIDAIEGWGKYWEENCMRYWVLLDGRIVRCSDGWLERDPVWYPELKLFIWYEVGTPYQVFYMDQEGHYRKWHAGHYWGKIPKRKTASNKKEAGDA